MNTGTADRVTFNSAAQTALRVLIASYFLAVSLEIIPGTRLGVLFDAILPEPYASATAAGLVFIFAFMIMLGMAMRVAALMVALMTFFASYVMMVRLGVVNELGAFWRDLALIAALLLTYGDTKSTGNRARRLFRRKVVPRRMKDIMARATLHDPEMSLQAMRPKNSERVTRAVAKRVARGGKQEHRRIEQKKSRTAALHPDAIPPEIDNIFA